MNELDYLKWRGDISFKQDPFNYVDGAVLSDFAYGIFDGFFDNNKYVSIESLCKMYKDDTDRYNMSRNIVSLFDFYILIDEISKNDRFKDLNVHNYVSILHSDETEQFAAMMIDISLSTTVVVFRGTDDNLAGWEENLQMSYKITKAQEDAVNYVNKYCLPLKNYILLGHSKGGNLALYAATNCHNSIKSRIKKIISYDGPGLSESAYNKDNYELVKKKYIKLIPEYDVVGIIFDNEEEDRIIVKSDAEGIKQHSLGTWQIERNRFIEVNELKPGSIKLKGVFDNFMESTTIEERQNFVKELFQKLYDANIDKLSDFASMKIGDFIAMIKNIGSISKGVVDTANILLKGIADVFGSSFVDNIENKVVGFVKDKTKQIHDLSNSITK